MNTTPRFRAVIPSILLLCGSVLLPACSSSNGDSFVAEADFKFAQGEQGWSAGFADYPPDREENFELVADYRPLPAELADPGNALFLSGKNESDDLFMYYARRYDGLQPGRSYRVRFAVEIASEAASGCIGIGGAPGESVYVKTGASTVEPTEQLGDDDHLRMNIDKGNQASGGRDAQVLGDLANGRPCDEPEQFVLKRLDSNEALNITANAQGAVWLLVGTDSGFEGTTRVYVTRFTATFSE